jgi:hypothetical protein
MACLMAGLTALGACYPSQNPAVAGALWFTVTYALAFLYAMDSVQLSILCYG